MATLYLDYQGGNDANNGTSFALRKQTFGSIKSVMAAGDTVRVMGCGAPKLVGNATWNNNSKTVTLASAVTQLITDCETNWTASANVTSSTSSTRKSGANSILLFVDAAFTTGKLAYFATGTLNLSGYQQVTFWFQQTFGTAIAANQISLRLCTDTTGDVSVHTFPLPAIVSGWNAVTVDLATNLNSAIQSVALYQDVDIGAWEARIDNINACKASSSADALTLSDMIGKVHNIGWVASTSYSLNDIRRPTQPNRNGFQYKVTTAGTSGSSEPTWPTEPGLTVTDGTAVWTCLEVEDTWYNIQSINGTTVLLDNSANTGAASGRGYAGATETISTYRFTPIPVHSQYWVDLFQNATPTGRVTYSGGWDRTNMSTQDGETWFRNFSGNYIFTSSGVNDVTLQNLHWAQYQGNGSSPFDQQPGVELKNVSFNGSGDVDPFTLNELAGLKITGMSLCNGDSTRSSMYLFGCWGDVKRLRIENNSLGSSTQPAQMRLSPHPYGLRVSDVYLRNNSQASFSVFRGEVDLNRVTTLGNGAANFYMNSATDSPAGHVRAKNCSFAGTLIDNSAGTNEKIVVYSQNDGGTANNHVITQNDTSTITSDSTTRNTASGISWRFNPKTTGVTQSNPMILSVAKILLPANTTKSVTIAHRRDSTNIQGQLLVRGSQVRGIPNDVTVSLAPTINTWTTSSPMSLTATEDGVVELLCLVWDGVGTTNNFWIDDLSVT